jgi:hypothetical protein
MFLPRVKYVPFFVKKCNAVMSINRNIVIYIVKNPNLQNAKTVIKN